VGGEAVGRFVEQSFCSDEVVSQKRELAERKERAGRAESACYA
jgi:hypothetical protein